MFKDELVTVVIPTYNHAHFLERALQSVLAQTYSHWEALVIDNHSQDNTDEVVRAFGDPRIRLLKINNNGVIAASRNLGIRSARGKWIAFLDSDDYWYDKKLEVVMALAKLDNDYDVLCHDELMADLKSGFRRVLRHGPYKEDFYKNLLIEGNRLSPSATAVKSSFLREHGLYFSEIKEYITVEDYDFWLNLAKNKAKFSFVNQILGVYTIHDTNNSAQIDRHLNNTEALLKNHIFNIQKFELNSNKLWQRIFTSIQLMYIRRYLVQKEYKIAFKLFIKSTASHPLLMALILCKKLINRYCAGVVNFMSLK